MPTLNIGMNRKVPGTRRKVEHKNLHAIEFDAPNGVSLLNEVLTYIQNNYPGWSLTGYAETRKDHL